MKLLLSIIVCLSAGLIGSLFTFAAIPTWYATLIKPSFSPPNWLFGPVWTTLYVLMGIAMYLVWRKRKSLNLFLIHLVFNAGWSIVFFGLHSILGGMVTIIILWGLIFTLIRTFYRIDRRTAYLLIPYLVWVSFASILNFSLLILNQGL
ncbi:MAG: tryptophan-rich sensory protein [Candidatus Gottesmanbacteria bacterium]|nr:tryptophan-rich sensory protein [Candidatus Gottesmanbacteria bacterium]